METADTQNGFQIVPIESDYIPGEEEISLALGILKEIIPDEEDIFIWGSDDTYETEVVGLFKTDGQKMVCPSCGRESVLEEGDVYALGEMLSSQPADEIETTMPCCGAEIFLSTIDFGPNLQFAQFGIEILKGSEKIDDVLLAKLGEALSCEVTKVIY